MTGRLGFMIVRFAATFEPFADSKGSEKKIEKTNRSSMIIPHCWWKKSCTTQHVWSLVNNGISIISTGQDFFHQQYHYLNRFDLCNERCSPPKIVKLLVLGISRFARKCAVFVFNTSQSVVYNTPSIGSCHEPINMECHKGFWTLLI